jgi:hypothetical protein
VTGNWPNTRRPVGARSDSTPARVLGLRDWLNRRRGVRGIEVLDVETGRSDTFDADPARWARNLPQAFRSGDLICDVLDDAINSVPSRDVAEVHA